ncbi:MAG: TIGR00730 family Rossman fold protein [bacterium]
MEERLTEISRELREGFELLKDYPKSVTFFGANQTKEDNPYYENARELAGRIVRELGYAVLTGGSSGIMEAANRGAYEAKGDSIGLQIKLPKEQATNKYLTKEISFHHFYMRKVYLSFAAEAYIFYPGGYGTLDEFFEIITLIQTKKIESVPVICIGSEYWHKIKKLIEEEILSRKNIAPEDLNTFTIIDSHDEILDMIKKAPVRIGIPFNTE